MISNLIIYTIAVIVGLLMNIYIKKVAEIIFRKTDRMAIIPVRIVGVFLVINYSLGIYHLLVK